MAFVALFMMSMTSINTSNSNIIELEKDCMDQVINIVNQAANAGESEEFLNWLTNSANAVFCYGYTWQDIIDAQGL